MEENERMHKKLSQSWDGRLVNSPLFYNAFNLVSKSMLDNAAGGTFMGKQITEAKKLLDNMQDNHAQWHVERSTTKKVNSVTPEENVELIAKLDELPGISALCDPLVPILSKSRFL